MDLNNEHINTQQNIKHMRTTQKIRMLVNEPSLIKEFIDRSSEKKAIRGAKLKTIFPPEVQLERFRQLEQARLHSEQDHILDHEIETLINKFEQQVKINQVLDLKIETKKEYVTSKLKMDYIEEQIAENLEELDSLIKKHATLHDSIFKEKKYIENLLIITQIKKALILQNEILKEENERLKIQELEINILNQEKWA